MWLETMTHSKSLFLYYLHSVTTESTRHDRYCDVSIHSSSERSLVGVGRVRASTILTSFTFKHKWVDPSRFVLRQTLSGQMDTPNRFYVCSLWMFIIETIEWCSLDVSNRSRKVDFCVGQPPVLPHSPPTTNTQSHQYQVRWIDTVPVYWRYRTW
jgi:hypothetical protein